ncbi:MAG: FGGY family carbohydrate kinase [Anaeroplasma sp.]
MSKYVIAIDQGTTSSRVIIFDERGNIICKLQKEFEQIYPFLGAVEHDPNQIYEDVVELFIKALNNVNIDYNDIIGVGITNQRETTVIWNKETGEPIYNAIVWQSNQSNEICQKLKDDGYSDFIQNRTGLLINPYFSATKIKWILDHVEGSYELMNDGKLMFGTIDTWLTYKLTNEHVTDYTNASRTMLFNINTLTWDDDILSILGINKNILPRVVDCNSTIGYIKEKRISDLVNLQICAIAGDQQASLIGHTCFNLGDLKITYGTGSFMLLNIGDKPILSHNGLLTTIGYSIDGKISYALEGSVFVAGSAFQFIKDNLEIVKSLADDEFSSKTSNGIFFVPSLTGLGAPYWNSLCKGAIFGLTRATKKSDIAWATIEGVSYLNNDVLTSMLEQTNIKLEDISVDGGASLNSNLMQTQANIMNSSIKTISTSEATSLGIFYLVGLNKKLFQNINQVKTLYKAIKQYNPDRNYKPEYDKWKKAVKACMEF